MIKDQIKNKKGFTIIEVVLVLAIAGLIFLMVFIALPALQSSQRNTQRENDLNRILTEVTDYSGNNNGRLPFTLDNETIGASGSEVANFVPRYIDDTCKNGPSSGSGFECDADQFRDPDGNLYQFKVVSGMKMNSDEDAPGLPASYAESIVDDRHIITAVVGVTCGINEGTVTRGTGNRQVALFMVLEGGSIACSANS